MSITPEEVWYAIEASDRNLGATLCYPQDRYGYVVIKASASGKTLYLVPLATPGTDTGHEPDHFEGPWPVWDHTYTDEERREMRRGDVVAVRWSAKKGAYFYGSAPVVVGRARYYRNYSY